MLDANQAKVKRLIEKGYSVYITGKGGCGKSFFITSIIEELRAKDICCFVTAPTGKAANNIGGVTIHSFAGIGTGSKGAHELISSIKANEDALSRWQTCELLVIDEVSMLSRELFEKLEMIARCLTKNSKTIWGNSVVVIG
jgi:ATP-dependent DNA helicase PIF1